MLKLALPLFLAVLALGVPAQTDSSDVFLNMKSLTAHLSRLGNDVLPFMVDEGTSKEIMEQLEIYGQQTIDEVAALKIEGSVTEASALAAANAASIIFFADLHNNPSIQQRAGSLFSYLDGANTRPKVFIAEWVYEKYQGELDRYLAGEFDTDELRKRIHFDGTFSPDWWVGYAELLELLKAKKTRVLAAFKGDENSNWADIVNRDAFVVDVVKKELTREPTTQVFLLHGRDHLIGKTHLADQLQRAYPGQTVAFLSAISEMYWAALQQGYKMDSKLYLNMSGAGENTYLIYTVAPSEDDAYIVSVLGYYCDPSLKEEFKRHHVDIRAAFRETVQYVAAGNSSEAARSLALLKGYLARWTAFALDVDFARKPGLTRAIRTSLLELQDFASK